MLVSLFEYGGRRENAIGVNINGLRLYFSYNTVIAFQDSDTPLTVLVNCWSNTTGKHLNKLQPDKSKRLNKTEFEQKLNQILQKHNLN